METRETETDAEGYKWILNKRHDISLTAGITVGGGKKKKGPWRYIYKKKKKKSESSYRRMFFLFLADITTVTFTS